jgi:regulatory protein
MARTITALTKQKKSGQRVNLFLDGEFAFGLLALTAANLRVGQQLSAAELEALRRDDAVNMAQERALSLLERRPRSKAEIRQRLLRAGFAAEAVEAALARLERVGLVDDAAFARYWVEQRLSFHPRSRRALRYELLREGVGREIIDQALSQVEDGDVAAALLRQYLAKTKEADAQKRSQAAFTLLRSRGFDYQVIKEAMAGLATEGSEPTSGADDTGPEGEGALGRSGPLTSDYTIDE